jgi:hypothetical protein
MDIGHSHLPSDSLLYSVGLRSVVWVTPFLAGWVFPIAREAVVQRAGQTGFNILCTRKPGLPGPTQH